MAGPASLIKAQIKVQLDALVTSGTLAAVLERDINNNALDADIPKYPCAILGTSNMQSVWEYQQANKRTYRFEVLIVHLQDELTSVAQMEDLRDAIALQFDNNFTLSGTAILGVDAAISERVTYAQGGKNYVLFNVTLRATTLANLTYNF